MDLQAYFNRINYYGSTGANINTLHQIHRAHLLTVPFENLDIHLQRPIVLDDTRLLYDKIVTQRRGGFCYEQNGLFAEILSEMGFNVTLMEARVGSTEGDFGIQFDHLTLMVELEERWLVDVGFGDNFLEPLRLDVDTVQIQDGKKFRVSHDGTRGAYARQSKDGIWADEYEFFFKPRQLMDFIPGCTYHQTSPDSSFTKKRVCSLATETGRKTISGDKLIITANSEFTEHPIADENEYQHLLKEHFGIEFKLS